MGSKEQILWGQLSRVRQSFQRCHKDGNLTLTGTGLLQTRQFWGEKNPSKILTVEKHFCNKGKQASTRSSTLGLKFQLLVSSSPRAAPPSLMGSLQSNYLLGPSALLVGDVPASISVPANIGACFPKPRLLRGRRIRVDILGLLWMQLLEAGCGWGWLCCHLKLQSC